jgi:hypothetical protein
VDSDGALKAVLVGSRRKVGFSRAQIAAFARAAVETADRISLHMPSDAVRRTRQKASGTAGTAGSIGTSAEALAEDH